MLVTVKTYPQPSVKYMETVCTAGLADDGRWLRLYPVPFRYKDQAQQYRLYDWIELEARKRPPNKDRRRESYEPVADLKVVGHVGTQYNWRERKRLILPHASESIESLLDGYEKDGESLGIIKPARVSGVQVGKDHTDWSPGQKALSEQMRLFGPQQKPLEKLSHRFSYSFRCEDRKCKGHRMQIADWGLCYLYVKTRRDEGVHTAVEKTTQKCEDLIADDRDVYFYVGTVYPKRSFMIVGMFYPKKEPSTA